MLIVYELIVCLLYTGKFPHSYRVCFYSQPAFSSVLCRFVSEMENVLKNKFDGLIFDLDGTLWDSTPSVAKAWQQAKTEVDYIKEDITPQIVAGIAGMAYDAIYDHLFPYLDIESRNAFKARCAKYEIEVLKEEGGVLYPGVKELIPELAKRYNLFIVSNCQNGYIENFLDFFQFHSYFKGHACYGTKTQPKAENIKDVVNDFNLKNPLYIGDTMGDYTSSVKAGVPFMFVSYGFGNVEEGQIATVNTFDELNNLL